MQLDQSGHKGKRISKMKKKTAFSDEIRLGNPEESAHL